MLLVCNVLSRGIMVFIIFKVVGNNCILVFEPKLLQHTHEYFGVSFT
jgi:hypothetical protein